MIFKILSKSNVRFKAKLLPSPHFFPTTYRETPLENTLENEKQQAEELIDCVDQISLVGKRVTKQGNAILKQDFKDGIILYFGLEAKNVASMTLAL